MKKRKFEVIDSIILGFSAAAIIFSIMCMHGITLYLEPYEQSVDQTIPNAYTEGTWNHELAEGACL